MVEAIGAFLSGVPKEIYVFLMSLLPIVELRGAIPLGAGLGLPFYLNYPLSVLGNMLPIPFILLFIPRILDFLARFKAFRPMVEWLRKRAHSKSSKVLREEKEDSVGEALCYAGEATDATAPIEAAAEGADSKETHENATREAAKPKMSGGVFVALMLFVAIPLPATGAWTGSLVAALFDLPKKRSLLAIFLGVLISGTIMSLASYGVLEFLKIFI